MAISKTQPMRPAEIDLIDAYNEIIQDIPTLKTTIETLVTEVGDENSGLVKDVNDLDTAVNGVSSAIGDENSGLVKDIDDLQSDVSSLQDTVGDENSGLVKATDDLETAVSGLKSVIGDSESGIIYDVTNISNTLDSVVDGRGSIGQGSFNFTFSGSAAFIVISRGTEQGIIIVGYWGTTGTVIGNITEVSITKENTSRDFTLTNTVNSKGIYLSPNITEITE